MCSRCNPIWIHCGCLGQRLAFGGARLHRLLKLFLGGICCFGRFDLVHPLDDAVERIVNGNERFVSSLIGTLCLCLNGLQALLQRCQFRL